MIYMLLFVVTTDQNSVFNVITQNTTLRVQRYYPPTTIQSCG